MSQKTKKKNKKKENKLIKVWTKYFLKYIEGMKKLKYSDEQIKEEIRYRAKEQRIYIDEHKANANEPLMKQLTEDQAEFIKFLEQVAEEGL